MNEIERVLLTYLEENFLPRGAAGGISPDDDLFSTGVIDSAGLLESVVFLEQHFGVTIPDEDLIPEHFSSLSAVGRYLQRRLEATGAGRR